MSNIFKLLQINLSVLDLTGQLSTWRVSFAIPWSRQCICQRPEVLQAASLVWNRNYTLLNHGGQAINYELIITTKGRPLVSLL
eukprot:Skav232087  [mRNA]  locus=scaffold2353:35345:35871:- [translate_table: standard]